MDKKTLDLIYDDYFESSYKHGNILTKEQFDMAADAYAKDYKEFLPEAENAAILDFGCGTGDFLYFLEERGYTNYWGIDISAPQVEYCRKNVNKRAECVDGIEFLKNKTSTYDLIVSHDVMEHIPKKEIFVYLHSIHDALKPGGTFIVRIPNMSNPLGVDARYNDITHTLGFTPKSVYQVLWLGGFRDIKILPPKEIPVKSFRNFVRKYLVKMLHKTIQFCYYIQDYTVPDNLDKLLVGVGKK